MDPLQLIELATGSDPAGSVIWLHGLGADGWDFVPIVRELPLPEGLALRFVFPHALRRLVAAAHEERGSGRAPRQFRELFHWLNALIQDHARRNP